MSNEKVEEGAMNDPQGSNIHRVKNRNHIVILSFIWEIHQLERHALAAG